MLKAIVAKVVRAAANAWRVGCALAEDLRGDARAACLVAAKKAVGAAFCGVATAVFLAPVSIMVVNGAVAQTQSPTCNDQNREGGVNTTGCGDCLSGYQEFGNQCETPINCPITGQTPDDSNATCVCPEDNFPIAGACQVPANFCTSEGLSLRDTFGTLQNADNPDADDAAAAYCRECPQGDNFERFAGKCQVVKDCSVVIGAGFPKGQQYRGQFVDRANLNNACVCPSGQTILPDPDDFSLRAKEQSDGADASGVKVCAPALPASYANTYTDADCKEAGWNLIYGAVTLAAQSPEPQGGFHLVESCEIPVELYARAIVTVLSTVTGNIQIKTFDADRTGSADSCVLRHNTGADVAAAVGVNTRFCNDPDLFGADGLPTKPKDFDIIPSRPDKLQIVSTMTAENLSIRISFKKQPVQLAGAAPVTPVDPTTPSGPGDPTTGTPTSTASGGGGGAGAAAGGGILLVALAYYAFSGHDSGASFAFTPQARYAIENDLELYRYGSRLEFRQDEWTLWWSADESSSGGGKSLNYGYGGQWSNDVLRASAGVNYGESQADMRAGLEAEWALSNWTIRPAYRFSAVTEEGEWNVKNGLDLTAKMTQAGWTVRPSVNAGLWSGDALDADLGLQVGREF